MTLKVLSSILSFKKLSIVFYIISLFTPMFTDTSYIGVVGLIIGPACFYPFEVYVAIPWLANIFYFTNLILLKIDIKISILLSVLSIICALFILRLTEIPLDEGGNNMDAVLGIGFYLWLVSFTVLLIGQIRKAFFLKDKN